MEPLEMTCRQGNSDANQTTEYLLRILLFNRTPKIMSKENTRKQQGKKLITAKLELLKYQ